MHEVCFGQVQESEDIFQPWVLHCIQTKIFDNDRVIKERERFDQVGLTTSPKKNQEKSHGMIAAYQYNRCSPTPV